MELCFSKRGKSDRTEAFKTALAHAENDFESKLGFRLKTPTQIKCVPSEQNACLQAVDYFLWALQRFYEAREVPKSDGSKEIVHESRYIEMLWPQVGEIHDLDVVIEKRTGAFYKADAPLNPDTRPFA